MAAENIKPNNSCYHFELGEKDERGSVFFSWDDRLSVALLVSDSDEMSVVVFSEM
jgi:hypothetical protein